MSNFIRGQVYGLALRSMRGYAGMKHGYKQLRSDKWHMILTPIHAYTSMVNSLGSLFSLDVPFREEKGESAIKKIIFGENRAYASINHTMQNLNYKDMFSQWKKPSPLLHPKNFRHFQGIMLQAGEAGHPSLHVAWKYVSPCYLCFSSLFFFF